MKKSALLFAFILIASIPSLAFSAPSGAGDVIVRPDASPCTEGAPEAQLQSPPERVILRNAQGVELGEIVNFLVDTEREVIAYAVVATDRALTMENMRLVPINALEVQSDEIILNMNPRQLADAPTLEPGLSPEEFNLRAFEYFGVAPYWEDQ